MTFPHRVFSMTDEEESKITVSFTERKGKRTFGQLKKLLTYYLILVLAIALLEAMLDLSGMFKFGFLEASVDFFVLIFSFIGLAYFTMPVLNAGIYRKRSIAALKVGVILLLIQITSLEIFYFAFPGLGYLNYFEAFIISEVVYQGAFAFITGRYKFARKFLAIQINDGIRIRKGSDGYVESIERSDFMTQDLRKAMEQKIRGEISEEEFLEAISGLEPAKRDLLMSMTSGIESRLRKKYRW